MAGSRRPAALGSAQALESRSASAARPQEVSDEEETSVADPGAAEEWGESTVVEDDPEAVVRSVEAAQKAAPSAAPGRAQIAPEGMAKQPTPARPRQATRPPPLPARLTRAGSLPASPRAPSGAEVNRAPSGAEVNRAPSGAEANRAPSGPAPGPAPRAASRARPPSVSPPVAQIAAQPTGPLARLGGLPSAARGLPVNPRGEARLRSSPPLGRHDVGADADEEESTMRPKRHRPGSFSEEASATLDELTTEDVNDDLGLLTLDRGAGFPLTASEEAKATLVVIAGNDRGRDLRLTGGPVIVGRGTDCDLVLTDIAASRKHIKLSFDGRRYQVRDLGSGNGTLVNDAFQDGLFALRDGDRIELGNTVLRIDHPITRAVAAPPAGGAGVGRPGAPMLEVDSLHEDSPGAALAFGDEDNTLGGPDGLATTPEPAAARALAAARHAQLPRPPTGTPGPLPMPPAPGVAAPPQRFESAPPLPMPRALAPAQPVPDYPRAPTGAAPVALPAPQAELPAEYNGMLLAPQARRRGPAILVGSALGAAAIAAVFAAFALSGDPDGDTSERSAAAGTAEGAALQLEPEIIERTRDEGEGELGAGLEGEAASDEEFVAADTPDDELVAEAEAAPEATPPPPPVERTLPASTWGTDEGALVARAEELRAAHARAEAERAERERAEAERARATPVRQITTPRAQQQAPRTPPRDASPAAVGQAETLYQNREFAAAASALRAAAAQVSANEAQKLRRRANGYERMGTYFERGQATRQSSPSAAFVAFQEAFRIDQQLGGAHSALLRAQISVLAPQAAGSYMANGRYEAAKDAADAADRFGAGGHPLVQRVRAALDRKAEELFRQAHGLRSSDPDRAVALLRQVQRIVPAGNAWRERATQMLAARGEN
jgi:hypothetical protein